MNNQKIAVLDICQVDNKFSYLSTIEDALSQADLDIQNLNETIESVNALNPQCDKLDYALSASSGALCGILDIFLVGKPGGSPLGEITDKWFENRTCDFAKLCGWKGAKEGKDPVKSAIGYLEKHYKIPYDQRGLGDAGSSIYLLDAKNHHFKSLGHNPSLLGLFFSILDQFTNSSHFVSDGQLIELVEADGNFILEGNSVTEKLWCGFVNWFGHLMSDVSGSSGGKGRGMGIPSPLWTWTNDIIAIKAKLNIPRNQFDKDVNELALNMYKEGFDFRFQTAQAIPVFINELIVRLFYSIRRLIKYYKSTDKSEITFKGLWSACEPFSNPTVNRMLTVAHGTFCLVDITDANIRGFVTGGGTSYPLEFFLNINVVGVGAFTICLYGEATRAINIYRAEKNAVFAQKQKTLVEDYIEGLNVLKDKYDDQEYLAFVEDLQNNNYITAFSKTASLAKLRGVLQEKVLETKNDIDDYFTRQIKCFEKKKNKLELESEVVESLVKQTNEKINELGQYDDDLYYELIRIQEKFDKIRNVPSDKQRQYQAIKEVSMAWKQQVDQIESDYESAKKIDIGSGAAGGAFGIGVATLGPTAAMGVATTWGVASTGTEIALLSGAAQTNAALAWLGGGALSAGGGGMAAGNALLALAGPIGWTLAGVALVSSALLFWKAKSEKQRLEEIFMLISLRDQNSYKQAIVEINERIKRIIDETKKLNEAILNINTFGLDYTKMTEQQQYTLGAYVNLMNSSTQLLVNPIMGIQPKYTLNKQQTNSNNTEYSSLLKDEKYQNLVVYIANLLNKIEVNESDRKLLSKFFKGNEELLKKMDLETKKFLGVDLFNLIDEALSIGLLVEYNSPKVLDYLQN